MADRRGSSTNRTFRPEPEEDGVPQLPTLAEILQLPAVIAGDPEVLAGTDALESPVRWVHVSDSLGVAKLLDGGELLLSTGVNWTADGVDLAGYVDELIQAGTVGLMLELVVHHTELPAGILDACNARGFPLIVLRSEVKFVAVT
jgi:purine catabolism regulator